MLECLPTLTGSNTVRWQLDRSADFSPAEFAGAGCVKLTHCPRNQQQASRRVPRWSLGARYRAHRPRTIVTGLRDVTFLPAQIQGRWFHLYLILDLYIRRQAKPLPRSVMAKALSNW